METKTTKSSKNARPTKAEAKATRHAVSSGTSTKHAVVVVDATGLVLGRMATFVAKSAIEGSEVHIINAEKAILVGSSKKSIQEHYHFKRWVGTSRKGPFFPREPHLIVKRTCRGMINYQSSSGRAAYKRIKAHVGTPKELVGQKSQTVEAAKREARSFVTIAELSAWLGSNRARETLEV